MLAHAAALDRWTVDKDEGCTVQTFTYGGLVAIVLTWSGFSETRVSRAAASHADGAARPRYRARFVTHHRYIDPTLSYCMYLQEGIDHARLARAAAVLEIAHILGVDPNAI